jgi:hypothetical protein
MSEKINKYSEERASKAKELELERSRKEQEDNFNFNAMFFSDVIELSKNFTKVKFNGTNIKVTSNSYSDAKIALKELRLIKKSASMKKRDINSKYKIVRDEYNQKVGNRGTLGWTVGTGNFGTVIRSYVRANRAAQRSNMADIKRDKEIAISPWDKLIDTVDQCIIMVESKKVQFEIEGQE